MKLYEDLLWRGLIKDVSNEEEAKRLLNEENVRFYCGFDPTGQSLTVGHLVQIVRMLLLETGFDVGSKTLSACRGLYTS
jgi:tyrosyl-tRNA synthetase